ncbi:MAG: DUF2794 domain-containing protein [Caulobacteraceae bacterium]|nr:DUF2794 domain-containing protein [Caulobacteraceae bacterium]
MSLDSQNRAPRPQAERAAVFFDRRELNLLLGLYGRMVAAGVWRDYAVAWSRDAAHFHVFRRTSETPLYRIEKRPALARRQGAWSITAEGGLIVRRGHELETVLRFFDRSRFRLV